MATVSCGSVACEAIDQHFQLIFAPIIRQHYVARERLEGKQEGRERGGRETGSAREFVVPCKMRDMLHILRSLADWHKHLHSGTEAIRCASYRLP